MSSATVAEALLGTALLGLLVPAGVISMVRARSYLRLSRDVLARRTSTAGDSGPLRYFSDEDLRAGSAGRRSPPRGWPDPADTRISATRFEVYARVARSRAESYELLGQLAVLFAGGAFGGGIGMLLAGDARAVPLGSTELPLWFYIAAASLGVAGVGIVVGTARARRLSALAEVYERAAARLRFTSGGP